MIAWEPQTMTVHAGPVVRLYRLRKKPKTSWRGQVKRHRRARR